MGNRGILRYVKLSNHHHTQNEERDLGARGQADAAAIFLTALTATPQGNRAFKRLGFTSRYAETKGDGDKAEMLVREGNIAFSSS